MTTTELVDGAAVAGAPAEAAAAAGAAVPSAFASQSPPGAVGSSRRCRFAARFASRSSRFAARFLSRRSPCALRTKSPLPPTM
eukprot:jgi/Chrpa1/17151/Chrysochromulina_OHIO_Genome00019109-RA